MGETDYVEMAVPLSRILGGRSYSYGFLEDTEVTVEFTVDYTVADEHYPATSDVVEADLITIDGWRMFTTHDADLIQGMLDQWLEDEPENVMKMVATYDNNY